MAWVGKGIVYDTGGLSIKVNLLLLLLLLLMLLLLFLLMLLLMLLLLPAEQDWHAWYEEGHGRCCRHLGGLQVTLKLERIHHFTQRCRVQRFLGQPARRPVSGRECCGAHGHQA